MTWRSDPPVVRIEGKERGHVMDVHARAKTLAAWKEWFNATVVAR